MASGKKYVNENFVHDCGETKDNPMDYVCSILEMGFTLEETKEILSFYLFNPPILKNIANASPYGPKPLRDYGWVKSNNMNRLEGRLLNASGIQMFCFIKSPSIDQTLDSMNMSPGSPICTKHPRAVLQQGASVTVREDGSITNNQSETRMECLFRHLRNSLAHNRTYLFANGNVLLEDCPNDGKKVSARILMPKIALLDWIAIVTAGPAKEA